ncbi:DUF3574 domain-containing protein [Desulfovibrio sp. OttesenSCG-928-I05]|nr:DUF3574 domain-containing protein [Desulfovibrio sp. OttesenSCG-928-I05]
MRIIALIIAFVAATVAWTPTASAAASVAVQENQTTYEIHCGTGNGSDAVTPEMFDQFYSEVVAPRFPQGTAIHTVGGRWRDPKTSSLVTEKAFVIGVEGNAGSEAASEALVGEIANEYVQRFGKANASCFVRIYKGITTKLYYADK